MINSVCGIRSTGRICTDLARVLEAQGHTVKIAYGRESVPETAKDLAVPIGSPLGVRLHGLKARLLDASGFGSRFATKQFLRWVREYDPDVIHLHNIHGYYLHVGLLFDYLRSSGKRVIWTLHDSWAFTGHSPICELKRCEKWTSGCGGCPLHRLYPASLVDRSSANWKRKKACFTGFGGMTVVTPSHWLASCAERSFLAEHPVKVIENGIDTTVFHPRRSDFLADSGLEGKRILLAVSTVWDDTKGLSDYLKLADRLGEPWRLVLVGMTKKQIEQLPPTVTGLERTSDPERLAEIYSASDLFLNLSYCESFSMVNVEAYACGVPVLSYEAGGTAETVLPNCGKLIPKGDLDALIDAIRSYWPTDERPARVHPDLISVDRKRMLERYISLYLEPPV
jgi:glycosyltransferase involved in cell wall biosynthesis